MKIHDLIRYNYEAVIPPWQSFGQISLWNDQRKDVQRKVDGITKSDADGFFVADICERVCGSVMADYVDDYVCVNCFTELYSLQ